MLLRLCKCLAAARLLILGFCAHSLSAQEPSIEVPYYPEVVFKGTALTCQFETFSEAPIIVATNGVEVLRLVSTPREIQEVTFFPKTATVLGIHHGDTSWSFKVVVPMQSSRFEEKDGFLFVDTLPAILLPTHALPPPLDRRWETVDLIKNSLSPEKSPLKTISAFMTEEKGLIQELRRLLPQSNWMLHPPDPAAWFQVHGFLLTALKMEPTDFIALEIDFYDLERGMSPQTWSMKWHFVLQELQGQTSYKDGMLFGPTYSETTQKWRSIVDPQLKSLARAHGLHFVDRSLPNGLWEERLLNRLGKMYQLP